MNVKLSEGGRNSEQSKRLRTLSFRNKSVALAIYFVLASMSFSIWASGSPPCGIRLQMLEPGGGTIGMKDDKEPTRMSQI